MATCAGVGCANQVITCACSNASTLQDPEHVTLPADEAAARLSQA